MPRICLSYRRADSGAIVGRIYDRLVGRYGAEAVFMDVSGIPYGADFRDHIQTVFRDAKVLIAVIGPTWLGQKEKRARIHEKVDPVRVEIHTALSQQILVLPVLIDNATMPSSDDLPRDIKEFAFRNAMRIDSGVDFPFHIDRLLTLIDQALGIQAANVAAKTADEHKQPPGSPRPDLPGSPTLLSVATAWCSRLLPYVLAPVVLLMLAHYLIVMKLDIDPVYLRLCAITIPFVCGFILFRRLQLGIGAAALLGLCVALIAVAGMTTIVGLVDARSIVPSSKAEWQEVFEYLVTITLATAAGSLLARVAYSAAPGRSGTV
jgi:hypothetical protein